MPKMGGLDFAREVRKLSEFQNIPMIAMTSRFSPEDIQNGFNAGFDMYLEKFKKSEVIQAVENLLSKRVAS